MMDVDEMWDAESARIWEELNAPDQYEGVMKKAATSLKCAVDLLDKGNDLVYDAISELDETPMADRVQSLAEEIDSLIGELRRMRDNYERGRRE